MYEQNYCSGWGHSESTCSYVEINTAQEIHGVHNKKLQYIYSTLREQIARPQKYVFMHVSIENPWIFKQNLVKLDARFVLSTNTVIQH